MAKKPFPLRAQLEEVLRLVADRTGHMIDCAGIIDGWSKVCSDPLPANMTHLRASRLLKPAVDEGRVRAVMVGGRNYLGPADRRDLPLPPAARAFLERGKLAEDALHRAAETASEMVPGRRIRQVWNEMYDYPPSNKSWSKILDSGISAGRVRFERVEGKEFFAPAGFPSLCPPRYVSDAARLREALSRATQRYRSRVPSRIVEEEVRADSELTLESDLSVGQLLSMMFGKGSVVGTKRGRHVRYYALPGGPTQARPLVLSRADALRRLIRLFWRATGGIPFSTRALKRYCRGLKEVSFPEESKRAWHSALQELEIIGDIVVIEEEHHSHLRWAPRKEWGQLTSDEQIRRLQDHRPSASATDWIPAPAGGHPPPHDPGDVSGADDMRRFVLERRRCIADAQPTPRDRAIVLGRPVTMDQLLDVESDRKTRNVLWNQIKSAGSFGRGRVRTSITKVGCVGKHTFWDVEPAESSQQYVRWREALHQARSPWIRRDFDAFVKALDRDRQRTIILGPFVLLAQCENVAGQIRPALDELLWATHDVPLLWAEENDEAETRTNLESMLDYLETVPGEISSRYRLEDSVCHSTADDENACGVGPKGLDDGGERPGATPASMDDARQYLNSARAADVLIELSLMPQGSLKVTSFFRLIRPLRPSIPRGEGGRGRPTEVFLDRIDVVDNMAAKAGGAECASFVARGMPALGRLRDCQPFQQTLDSEYVRAHGASAVALGLLDDPESRAALVSYIARHLSGDQPGTSLTAVEEAVYGLAPLPYFGIADSLEGPARDVLEEVARRHPDEGLKRTVARVLRAWDDAWSSWDLLKKL